MVINDILKVFNEEVNRTGDANTRNAEDIAHTFYEYHGRHDDGTDVADALANEYTPVGFSGVIVV